MSNPATLQWTPDAPIQLIRSIMTRSGLRGRHEWTKSMSLWMPPDGVVSQFKSTFPSLTVGWLVRHSMAARFGEVERNEGEVWGGWGWIKLYQVGSIWINLDQFGSSWKVQFVPSRKWTRNWWWLRPADWLTFSEACIDSLVKIIS